MRRILTAVLLIPCIVGLVLWGPSYLLAVFQLALAEVALWEFFRLAEGSGARVVRVPGYVFAGAISVLSLAGPAPVWLLAALVLFLMVLLEWAMLSRQEMAGFLASASSTFLGVFYVAVPLSLLVWVCLRPGGRLLVLFGLIAVWVGDTAAFFVGSAWGRHKLSLQISPGKTWEGSAASLTAAVLAGLIFVRFFWRGTDYLEAAALAVVINIAAQTGDLAESALKRSAGVKDSSHLVPGHGGVLDRIDALLFAAPVLWYYYVWKAF
jgi:phosphatidate cytidylyltransferase